MNYPLPINVDFLCRDSILAAPLALDLALFSDLASRAGMAASRVLSFYYIARSCARLYPEHDLFIHQPNSRTTLR